MPIKEYDNPYKNIGVLHNQILAEIIQKVAIDDSSNPQQLVDLVKATSLKYILPCESYNEKSLDSIMSAYAKLILANPDIEVMLNFLDSKGFYSSAVKDKIFELQGELLTHNNSLDSINFDEIYRSIVDFEWEIAKDYSRLNTNDRESLLKVTAIAKESCKFWFENKSLYFANKNINSAELVLILVADASSFWCIWCSALSSFVFFLASATTT